MTVKSLILLLLGGVLVNNLAFEKVLGLVPVLGSKDGKKAMVMAEVSAVSIACVAVLAWWVENLVLVPHGLTGLRIFVYTLLAVLVVYLPEALFGRLGKGASLTVLNSALIGCAVNNAAAGYSFAATLAAAIGAGLGFAAAMFVFSGIRGRIQQKYVPAAFRGLPIYLLAAGIISMALVAYA